MSYGPYHIQTETQYSSFKAAKDAFGILGLNTDNCIQYGFVIPTDEPRPEITATQKATKAGKPTENPDGSWSYKWTVRDKTSEELQRDQEQFAKQVKAECRRRILDVADSETQQNIAQAGILYSAFRLNDMTEADALSQAGLIAGDMTTAADFRGWVAAMSQTAGALIMAGDDTYQDDTHWPPVPNGVAELAERF